MFSRKFYIRVQCNNALMLRVTNNRKSAEITMGYNMTEEQLADCLSIKPSRVNSQMASLIRRWQQRILDVKIAFYDRCNENSATDED